MLAFTLTLLAIFIGGLALFHYTLLERGLFSLSERQWESVDYIWYGFAFVGLAVGGFQVQASAARAAHADLVKAVESKYFQIEQVTEGAIRKHCPKDPPQCQLLADIRQAIRETQFTSGWPLAPVRLKGRVFDSLNLLIQERSRELNASALDGLVGTMTTSALEIVGEARESEKKLNALGAPVWLVAVMPYLLAVVVALRTTKVTFKVRHQKGLVQHHR